MMQAFLTIILTAISVSQDAAFAPTPSSRSSKRSTLTTTTSLANAADNGAVLELLDSNFASLFDAEKPLLIDAYAPWCGPCKLIEPIIERCAQEWSEQLTVSRWNVESLQTDVKIELLLQGENPRKLPSLILVHEGQAKAIHSGMISDDELDELLRSHLPLKSVDASNGSTETDTKGSISDSWTEKYGSDKKAGFISFGMNKADEYMLSMGR